MESYQTNYELGLVLQTCECSEQNVYLKYTLYELLYTAKDTAIYSITVSTCTDGREEIVSAWDISRSKAEALRLFHLLADKMVTSCTLYDVLEDLL